MVAASPACCRDIRTSLLANPLVTSAAIVELIRAVAINSQVLSCGLCRRRDRSYVNDSLNAVSTQKTNDGMTDCVE